MREIRRRFLPWTLLIVMDLVSMTFVIAAFVLLVVAVTGTISPIVVRRLMGGSLFDDVFQTAAVAVIFAVCGFAILGSLGFLTASNTRTTK
jgi:archaellum biogenesis protein FlaJ (TadC family)